MPKTVEYALFADESGTSNADKCYSIGCVLVPLVHLNTFEANILDLVKTHNLPAHEYKWSRIRNNYGVINFMIDTLRLILQTKASFICKVVWKEPFAMWHTNEERAFYVTYTNLLKQCARRLNSDIKAKIDEKQDSYDKHHEVVQIIANHQLKDLLGSVSNVERCNSKNEILIQVADLLTGAINASHNVLLNKNAQINPGKKIAIKKLAETLGWDELHYDTFPNADFNIWHFPWQEYRGKPATKAISPNYKVAYVTPDDFL